MNYKNLEDKLEFQNFRYYSEVIKKNLNIKEYFDILRNCYYDDSNIRKYYYSLVEEYQRSPKKNKDLDLKIFELYKSMNYLTNSKNKKSDILNYNEEIQKFAIEYLTIKKQIENDRRQN